MSSISFSSDSRLSDSIERDLMRDSLSNGEAVSIMAVATKVASGIKSSLSAFAQYMIDVTKALDEARAKDARYTRTAW